MMDFSSAAQCLCPPVSPGTDFPASITLLMFLFTPVTQGCRKSAADCGPVPLPPLSYGTSRAPCSEAGWLPSGRLSPTAERGTASGSGNQRRRRLADVQAKGRSQRLHRQPELLGRPWRLSGRLLWGAGAGELSTPAAVRGWDLLPPLCPGTWAA